MSSVPFKRTWRWWIVELAIPVALWAIATHAVVAWTFGATR